MKIDERNLKASDYTYDGSSISRGSMNGSRAFKVACTDFI